MNPPILSTPQSSVPTLHQTIIKETVRNPEKINNQHNIASFSHKSKNYNLRHIVASIRILWSVICKSIPWAKVNFLCDTCMSIFIHVASRNLCTMPKSIYNMGKFTYHMLNFINVMRKFMCDMRYLTHTTLAVCAICS